MYKLNVDAAHQRRRQMMWTVTGNVQNQNWKSFSITVEYPKHLLIFSPCPWYVSEILKCLSVATKIETSGRSRINWITSEIEMIG
jgi:hypothetical protein